MDPLERQKLINEKIQAGLLPDYAAEVVAAQEAEDKRQADEVEKATKAKDAERAKKAQSDAEDLIALQTAKAKLRAAKSAKP